MADNTTDDMDNEQDIPVGVEPLAKTRLLAHDDVEPEETDEIIEHVRLTQNSEDMIEDARSHAVVSPDNFADTAVQMASSVPKDGQRPMAVYAGDHGEGKNGSRVALVVGLIALFVTALVVGGSWALELWGGKSVPNVIGLNQASAVAKIEAKGLVADVSEEPVDDGVGMVVSSDPTSGTRVEPKTVVHLVVGVARTIPDVMGKSSDEAKQLLIQAGAKEENIAIVLTNSDEAEGSVIGIDPGVGARFASRDTIKLSVAQAYTVPALVGKTQLEAENALKSAGFEAEVTTEQTDDSTKVGKVIKSNPEEGSKVKKGTKVTIVIGTGGPKDYRMLADYFKSSPKVLQSFLVSSGFSLNAAAINSSGNLEALFAGGDKGIITFTSTPFAVSYQGGGAAQSTVVETASNFNGVRWDMPTGQIPSDAYNLSGQVLDEIAKMVGLSGVTQTINRASIRLPEGIDKDSAADFIAGYGESGDLCYTIFVTASGKGARVSVTVAKKSLYNDYDVSQYGGSILSMVAYSEAYVS